MENQESIFERLARERNITVEEIKDVMADFLTVKRCPCIVRIVIIQKTWGEADTRICRYISQCGIMVCAVEVVNPYSVNHTVLYLLQRGRGAAPDHKDPPGLSAE